MFDYKVLQMEVEEREVFINRLWVALTNQDCVIIKGDCKTKYIVVSGVNIINEKMNLCEVSLVCDEGALHRGKKKGETVIRFVLPEGWRVLDANRCGSYSFRLFLVRSSCYNRDESAKSILWRTRRRQD